MKTKKLFLAAMLSACGMMGLSAQIKVETNGRVHAGAEVQGPVSSCLAPSPFLYLGNKSGSYSGTTAPYAFIRNSDLLYLTTSRYDYCMFNYPIFTADYSGRMGIGKAPDAACNVDVSGQLRAANVPLTSDERLKRNIQPVSQELVDNLYDLKAQSYEKLEIRTELIPDDKGNMVEQVILKEPDQKYIEYGFMAQELQKLFPDLISTGADGYLSVRYISLIPVMIEAIKEQKATINELRTEMDALKGKESLRSATDEETTTGIASASAKVSRLYQNTPNPFTGETEIRYELPATVQNAYICIFDMQGKMLKKINALTGENTLKIKGSELQAGMYLYSLIADGKEIDTKKMILTK
jgi:hypothetical protein